MIQITKRVDLDFLGDQYKGSYINVRSISMRERDDLIKELDVIQKDPKKSDDFVKNIVLDRFVAGELRDGDKITPITKDDLLDFPAQVFLEITAQIQGKISPNS